MRQNPDVKQAGINPLIHYERHGRHEGRAITIMFQTYSVTIFKKILNRIKRNIAKLFYFRTIQKNKHTKIAVVLHLFYMESWDAIKQYLTNLNSYNYDLIVTCIKGHYDKSILKQIENFHAGTKFFIYPNKGFDIGTFIDVLSKMNIYTYDIVFKLHSKGIHRESIYIYNQIFKNKDWFYNLYDGILGAFSVHRAINAFSKDKKIGLIASKNLIVHDPKHKSYFTKQVAIKYTIKIKNNYSYVAGSCFIIRTKCLETIMNLNLNINSFAKTQRGVFSFAHAMERLVCASVEAQNFKIHGIPVRHNTYSNEIKIAHQTSAIRLLNDKRIDLNYEFFYRSIEGRKIKNYYIQSIALRDINRSWKGKIIKLHQCAPYIYLNGNIDTYKRYCKENKRIFNIEMSVNRYDNLIASIESHGFNTKSMPVINADNNIIMDGQHRCCYLLKQYGPDYKVKALFIEMATN